jgi:hypothetical protein
MSDNLTKAEKDESAWNTGHEKNYLKRLSQGEEVYSCSLSVYVSPIERLKAYLVAAENRAVWGDIEAAKVVSYAHELIWRLTH